MSKLSVLTKSLNQKFKEEIVGSIGLKDKKYERIPFISPALTWIFRGGLPRGSILEISGTYSSGKAQPLYSKVLTENGWKNNGDIRLFDKIYCEDGKLHDVIGVFPQGEKDVYEIEFTTGNKCRCSDEHLWAYSTDKLASTGKDFTYTKTLAEIIDSFKESPARQNKYRFPLTDAVEYSEKEYDIPPYIIGLLLGDGHINSHCIQFINAEEDILDTMISYGNSINCKVTVAQKPGCKCITYSKLPSNKLSSNAPSVIKTKLVNIGLFGTMSHTKFIPEVYKYGSKEQRLKLLAGLINTDGYIGNHGMRYSTTSLTLCNDILEVARSLGMIAIRGADDFREKSVNVCYTIGLANIKDLIPYLSIKHRSKELNWTKHRVSRIKTIKYIGKEECQCIYVDNPTHLYLTDDFTVTHNTTLTASIAGQFQKKLLQEYQDELALLEAIDKPTQTQKSKLAQLQEEGNKKVLWVDVENSVDSEWFTKLGVDVDDLILFNVTGQSAEQILETIINFIETDCIGLVVIDSVGAMISKAQFDKTIEEKSFCGISQPMSVFAGKAMQLTNKYGTTIIAINQERDVIGSQYPTQNTPGGRAFKFACHARLQVRKDRFFDKTYKEVPDKTPEVCGQYSSVFVAKNKLTKPDRKLASFTIGFEDGIDYWNDAFEMGVTLSVITKAGSWYAIMDDDNNPVIDADGTNLKFQGKKQFITYMKEHKEFTDDLINKINEESCK